jgi:hypothetical protein
MELSKITILVRFIEQISPKNKSDCTFLQQFCILKITVYLEFEVLSPKRVPQPTQIPTMKVLSFSDIRFSWHS